MRSNLLTLLTIVAANFGGNMVGVVAQLEECLADVNCQKRVCINHDPCLGESMCIQHQFEPWYKCLCPPGAVAVPGNPHECELGEFLDFDNDGTLCQPDMCDPSATCNESEGFVSCVCPNGDPVHIGQSCEDLGDLDLNNDADPCTPNHCDPRASCQENNSTGLAECVCPVELGEHTIPTGYSCGGDVNFDGDNDPCNPNRCDPLSTCSTGADGSAECLCPDAVEPIPTFYWCGVTDPNAPVLTCVTGVTCNPDISFCIMVEEEDATTGVVSEFPACECLHTEDDALYKPGEEGACPPSDDVRLADVCAPELNICDGGLSSCVVMNDDPTVDDPYPMCECLYGDTGEMYLPGEETNSCPGTSAPIESPAPVNLGSICAPENDVCDQTIASCVIMDDDPTVAPYAMCECLYGEGGEMYMPGEETAFCPSPPEANPCDPFLQACSMDVSFCVLMFNSTETQPYAMCECLYGAEDVMYQPGTETVHCPEDETTPAPNAGADTPAPNAGAETPAPVTGADTPAPVADTPAPVTTPAPATVITLEECLADVECQKHVCEEVKPCQGLSSCMQHNFEPWYKCICNPGTLPNPETHVCELAEFLDFNNDGSLCEPGLCDPIATCDENEGFVSCVCPDGRRVHIGQDCVHLGDLDLTNDDDPCTPNHCDPRATCQDSNSTGLSECVCPPNLGGQTIPTGYSCGGDVNIDGNGDPCDPDRCDPLATCTVAEDGSAECVCPNLADPIPTFRWCDQVEPDTAAPATPAPVTAAPVTPAPFHGPVTPPPVESPTVLCATNTCDETAECIVTDFPPNAYGIIQCVCPSGHVLPQNKICPTPVLSNNATNEAI